MLWLALRMATPTFVPSGPQQWMCAAVSGAVKPKNPAMICIVSAVGSSTTTAVPAPPPRDTGPLVLGRLSYGASGQATDQTGFQTVGVKSHQVQYRPACRQLSTKAPRASALSKQLASQSLQDDELVEKPTASPQQSPVTESLALGRPQIPGQLSASVRPGGSLTEAKCWAVRFPVGRGRPAPTRPSKNQIDCRKVVVGALRVHWPLRHASPNECRAEAPPERGCWHIGYFAGMT
jgi:hypothetical protein